METLTDIFTINGDKVFFFYRNTLLGFNFLNNCINLHKEVCSLIFNDFNTFLLDKNIFYKKRNIRIQEIMIIFFNLMFLMFIYMSCLASYIEFIYAIYFFKLHSHFTLFYKLEIINE